MLGGEETIHQTTGSFRSTPTLLKLLQLGLTFVINMEVKSLHESQG